MKRKMILSMLAATVLSMGLTGCGFDLSLGGTPKTAADVIEKYQKANEETNFHMEGDLKFAIGMDAEGMSIDVPINLNMDMDFADENAHGEMDMKMSFMGEKLNQSAEMYMTKDSVYTYDEDDGYWTVSDRDSKSSFNDMFTTKAFEDASLVVDKKAKTYTVEQPLLELMENDELSDIFDMGDLTDSMSIDEDDLEDVYKDAKVVYVFDNSYRLVSISLSDMKYEDTIKEDGYTADVYLTMEFNFEFSKFGEIDADDVKVPKSVKSEAIKKDSSFLPDMSDGPVYDDDPEISEIINDLPTDVIPDAPVVQPATGNDILGAYNGAIINSRADWYSTFGADGWVFDNADGEYSFMTCKNDKYPDVTLYVFNKARSKATSDDILNDGYYGYNIDIAYNKGRVPNMSFNGLTWGASDRDVLAAYGNPVYQYAGSMYTSYEYELSSDISMTFYVYPVEGLQKVEVSVFSY